MAYTGKKLETKLYDTYTKAEVDAEIAAIDLTAFNSPVQLKNYTTTQRNALTGLDSGDTIYNSTTGSIEFYDGANWIATNLIPTVNSVSGTIYAGVASTLTLSVTNATDAVTVRFAEGGATVADVTDISVSSGSASVDVPSAVYGQSAGDTITVSILNQDGTPSSNAIVKTVIGLPTGGTITTFGSYRVHAFTSSSTFTVPTGFSLTGLEYLVIGGGAGGHDANERGGGGGAGGYRSSVQGELSGGNSTAESTLSLTSGSYTITIGGGGSRNSNGGNTTFHTITSIGGGTGGNQDGDNGQSGGSGGGAGGDRPGSQGAGTSGQGFAGGNAGGSSWYSAGGGGGASQTPANSPVDQYEMTNHVQSGGHGLSSSITGTSITRAGGGGGDWYTGSNGWRMLGGNGGGGNGGKTQGGVNGTAGTANTGSGGGGGDLRGCSAGAGGSGIVIIRYQL